MNNVAKEIEKQLLEMIDEVKELKVVNARISLLKEIAEINQKIY